MMNDGQVVEHVDGRQNKCRRRQMIDNDVIGEQQS